MLLEKQHRVQPFEKTIFFGGQHKFRKGVRFLKSLKSVLVTQLLDFFIILSLFFSFDVLFDDAIIHFPPIYFLQVINFLRSDGIWVFRVIKTVEPNFPADQGIQKEIVLFNKFHILVFPLLVKSRLIEYGCIGRYANIEPHPPHCSFVRSIEESFIIHFADLLFDI